MTCPKCSGTNNHFIGYAIPNDVMQAKVMLDYSQPKNQILSCMAFGNPIYSCEDLDVK